MACSGPSCKGRTPPRIWNSGVPTAPARLRPRQGVHHRRHAEAEQCPVDCPRVVSPWRIRVVAGAGLPLLAVKPASNTTRGGRSSAVADAPAGSCSATAAPSTCSPKQHKRSTTFDEDDPPKPARGRRAMLPPSPLLRRPAFHCVSSGPPPPPPPPPLLAPWRRESSWPAAPAPPARRIAQRPRSVPAGRHGPESNALAHDRVGRHQRRPRLRRLRAWRAGAARRRCRRHRRQDPPPLPALAHRLTSTHTPASPSS